MFFVKKSLSQNFLISSVISIALLTACGGGGSNDNSPPTPVANTAPDVQLNCGATEIFRNSLFVGCEYTVSDAEDNESTLSITTNFDIDTSVPGEYTLSVSVKDTQGLSASEDITIKVLEGTEDDRDADNWTNDDEIACGNDPDDPASIPADENENNECDVIEKSTDADGDKVPAFYDWDDSDSSESKDDDGDGVGNYADRDELIHIFISQDIQTNLITEVQQFKAALEEDTNSSVVVSLSPDTPIEIMNLITDEYLNSGLEGVFFIGEIPTITSINTEFPDIQTLTDHPYRAPFCPFIPDDEDSGIFYNSPEFSLLLSCLPEIWLSRIDATMSGSLGVEQIRTYLQKNIALRKAYANWEEGSHINFATPRDSDFENTGINATSIFKNHPLYNVDEVEIVAEELAAVQKNSWIEALRSNIEIAKVQIHGAPSSIQFHGKDLDDFSNLVNSELNDIDIKTKYIDFTSCSVGRFTQEDYMAATSLFNGDTLLVSAYPNDTFSSNSLIKRELEFEYRAFGYGASPAQVYKHTYSGSPQHFFGDPTVALREKKLLLERPRLFINQEHFTDSFVYELDLGSTEDLSTKTVPIEIMNTGNTTLELRGDQFNGSYLNVNSRLPSSTSGFVFEFNGVEREGFSYIFTVPPGETREMIMSFKPDAHNDKSLLSGAVYETVFRIVTNDPVTPVFTLKVKGTHIKN